MNAISSIGSQSPMAVSGAQPMTMMSPPPTAYLQGSLSPVAHMLSMSMDDLRSTMKQGSSLSDIASQKGVSRSSLMSVIEQSVQQSRAAQGREPISSTILDSVIGNAVDRRRGGASGSNLTTAA